MSAHFSCASQGTRSALNPVQVPAASHLSQSCYRWEKTILCDNVDASALPLPSLPPVPPDTSFNSSAAMVRPSYAPEHASDAAAILQGSNPWPLTHLFHQSYPTPQPFSSEEPHHSPLTLTSTLPQFGPTGNPPSIPTPTSDVPIGPVGPVDTFTAATPTAITVPGDADNTAHGLASGGGSGKEGGGSIDGSGDSGSSGVNVDSISVVGDGHNLAGDSISRDGTVNEAVNRNGDGEDEWEDENDPPASSSGLTLPHRRAESSIAADIRKAKLKELVKAIDNLREKHNKDFRKLAEVHNVSIKKVKKLFSSAPQLNKKRVNSEMDAIIHTQAQLMNASKSPGHRANIAEIQRAAKENKELQAARKDKEKMAQLLQDLEEYQQDKKQGARVSNKMGASHTTKLLHRFKDEFAELRQSTEIAGFGIFICETFESSVQPTIIGGGPIADFFMQTFKKSIWEVLCLFKSYMTTASKCSITGEESLVINYKNFQHAMVAQYRIDIHGWPEDVLFMSPRSIDDSEKLNTLYQAWKCGEAYWYKLTEWQKQRSDAGGTHRKQKRSTTEDSQEHSTKCARKSSTKERRPAKQKGLSVKRPSNKKKQVATEGEEEGASESGDEDKEEEDELDD
ncbi:hypothetical protein GYMLUDRAFT_238950 [Collybiopsis luxurians FD-317 M1]|nr:hypothetical protein GYMLUDRAFT_238950 [Collybiopsis luxurians FD-317 M1]